MTWKVVRVLLAVAAMTFAGGSSPVYAQSDEAVNTSTSGETTPAMAVLPVPQPGWLERDTLTGDWGGIRPWLKERGINLRPRLTQFYQGMPSGDGDHAFKYGGKADLLLNADLGKLGLWGGFSMTVHAEYNFGKSVNGYGGTIALVNTALYFPGIKGADAFDLSSVYFGQKFGDSVSLLVGKINVIDLAASTAIPGAVDRARLSVKIEQSTLTTTKQRGQKRSLRGVPGQ